MAKKLVRDAVHGDIELGSLEVELIDTPEFQRLRGIRQLGTAYLVFPSAMHTRFEHSLGTSWMAHRIVEVLRRHCSIDAEAETRIRVSALLHDITHIPFGHTLEDERRVLPRHDKDYDRVRYFFETSAIGRILEREGMQAAVISAVTGSGTLESDIVGGAISADLLDYLRRDTYFCGLAQNYDSRIFESFMVENGRLVMDLQKGGILRRDAMSELVNLLRIRYTLSERVYFHHTKIASGAMISKAVELALQSGFAAEELRTLKDETLVCVLMDRFADRPEIVHLLTCLERRELYKPASVMTIDVGEDRRQEIVRRFHEDRSQREALERQLADCAGLAAHQIIVYCPSFGMSLPEAEVPVRMEADTVLPLSGSNNDEIRILKEKHKALWKFFVLMDRSGIGRRPAVAAAAESILGKVN